MSRVPYAPFTKIESPDYAPAMRDRYLAALPAMSLIPFVPFFTADFLAPFFALLLESPAVCSAI